MNSHLPSKAPLEPLFWLISLFFVQIIPAANPTEEQFHSGCYLTSFLQTTEKPRQKRTTKKQLLTFVDLREGAIDLVVRERKIKQSTVWLWSLKYLKSLKSKFKSLLIL